MLESMQFTIDQLDQFLTDSKIGTLIVYPNQAFLQANDGSLIELDDSVNIEVFNIDEWVEISYQQAISTLTNDRMPLYAGLKAKIKER